MPQKRCGLPESCICENPDIGLSSDTNPAAFSAGARTSATGLAMPFLVSIPYVACNIDLRDLPYGNVAPGKTWPDTRLAIASRGQDKHLHTSIDGPY